VKVDIRQARQILGHAITLLCDDDEYIDCVAHCMEFVSRGKHATHFGFEKVKK